MRVAVAGGTGMVGRYVVTALSGAGHEPVVLARSRGIDLTTGAGLAEALEGARAVVDVSNVATMSRKHAVAYFTAASRHLLAAGERAGVEHHLALSIVGIDRVDLGYYEGKLRQEETVLAGPVPATVLRATQFHEFAGQTLDRLRGPLAVVPRMRIQPVAAAEVADELVRLVAGPAAGRAPELAGPEVLELVDLARQVLDARGSRRLLVPLTLPGSAGRALRDGALLPAQDAGRGHQTFTDWLARTRPAGG